MLAYKPLKISNFKEGLIQERVEFDFPNDGFSELRNAYTWRGGIVKKQGLEGLGRLRRIFTNEVIAGGALASPWSFNIFTTFTLAGNNPDIEQGSVEVTIGAIVFTDNGNGTLSSVTPSNNGTINYATGDVTLTHTAVIGTATTISYNYFPCLPVMGIRTRERTNINDEQSIAFDTNFAYRLGGSTWVELASTTPTTWSGSDSDFFWTTNYWRDATNNKLFWATNFINAVGNDMRYYDGTTWTAFAPTITGTTLLLQSLILLPFRGRLVALNIIEGNTLGGATTTYPQRVRWPAIGDPIATDAYRQDIRGKGSYLDIPTSEAIVSAGFVRDNLVIFCESSTWQLRYTGNVIQPFQIERVNSELGVESTFSGVQFDTSIVGMGDKGIVECDSFQSQRIDDKIIDFVRYISNENNGTKRVHGIRNFAKRLAYWSYPNKESAKFPNKRLVFNYEDQSWAIFDDHITALGNVQITNGRTWETSFETWAECDFTWRDFSVLVPEITGGNQRGFIFILDRNVTNDPSLTITGITGNEPMTTSIQSIDHGLKFGDIIEISGITTGSLFASELNDKRFRVGVIDSDNFNIFAYNPEALEFNAIVSLPATHTYEGGGRIVIVDNFVVTTKKFNFLEEGKRIKIGYIDLVMSTTASGEITMKVIEDYNSNILNKERGDQFFNTIFLTSPIDVSDGSLKTVPRIFCNVRGTFLSLLFTLSDAQMNSISSESNVRFDGMVIWARPAEKELYTGAI